MKIRISRPPKFPDQVTKANGCYDFGFRVCVSEMCAPAYLDIIAHDSRTRDLDESHDDALRKWLRSDRPREVWREAVPRAVAAWRMGRPWRKAQIRAAGIRRAELAAEPWWLSIIRVWRETRRK